MCRSAQRENCAHTALCVTKRPWLQDDRASIGDFIVPPGSACLRQLSGRPAEAS